jgi:hypothetical protein
VPVVSSQIRPKTKIFNIEHGYALWIGNFILMMKKIQEYLFWDFVLNWP